MPEDANASRFMAAECGAKLARTQCLLPMHAKQHAITRNATDVAVSVKVLTGCMGFSSKRLGHVR